MRAVVVEILDEPWNATIGPVYPIDPGPNFLAHRNITEGVDNVIVFTSAFIRTLVENLEQ